MHADKMLRRLHLMQSWISSAAACEGCPCTMFCALVQPRSLERAYGPWQPYPHDIYGPTGGDTIVLAWSTS